MVEKHHGRWFGFRITPAVMAIVGAMMVAVSGGTSLADDATLLITKHQAAGLTCASCHNEKPPQVAPDDSKCVSCHGDQAKLAVLTKNANPNPHAPPHLAQGQTQACKDCHHVHKPSEVSCTDCHHTFQFNVK